MTIGPNENIVIVPRVEKVEPPCSGLHMKSDLFPGTYCHDAC